MESWDTEPGYCGTLLTMKRFALAALLLTPGLAAAVCYIDPISEATYCYAAEECPTGTTWQAGTLACLPSAPPPAAPRACIVEVIYPQGAPSQPQIKVSDWCDSEEAAKALLAVAAKILVPQP